MPSLQSDAAPVPIRDRWIGNTLSELSRFHKLTDILDVGANDGRNSDKYRRKYGRTWHGIEISEDRAERYRLSEKYDHFHVGDVRNWQPVGTFSVAIVGGVFDHLLFLDAMDVYYRLLKASRFVMFSVSGDGVEPFLTHWNHSLVLASMSGIYGWQLSHFINYYIAKGELR